MKNYAVFGNPINHSKSPFIHKIFAKQIKIDYSYSCIQPSINNFFSSLDNFFNTGGNGANITSPFKEKAIIYANKLTRRATLSGAVNTFKLLENGTILGDNTDGIGLISDLKKLSFIQSGFHVLLIGSGGAARGSIVPLLSFNSVITITNRTFSRAKNLESIFANVGEIHAVELKNLRGHRFDLIINATSSSLFEHVPSIPSEIIKDSVFCYDMSYQQSKTPFLTWCTFQGAKRTSNGIGMLVRQAAYTVLFWHNVLPEVESIIKKLKIN